MHHRHRGDVELEACRRIEAAHATFAEHDTRPAVAGGEHKKMLGPVIGYSLVISAMLVSAFGTADGWAVAGAGLFYVSDTTLAFNRFVRPSKVLSVTVMVTYHLGQAGLVAWLV